MESIILYVIYATIAAFALLVVADYATRSETVQIAPVTDDRPDTATEDVQPVIESSETVELLETDAIDTDEPTDIDEPLESAIATELVPDETDETERDDRPSFHTMTVRQQRAYAKRNGIQIPRQYRKKSEITEYLRFAA